MNQDSPYAFPERFFLKTISFAAVFILIFFIFTLISISSATAELEKRPLSYKATNVDQCIQERECLWYAFSSYMGFHSGRVVIAGLILDGRTVNYLTRWEGPINYQIVGGYSKNKDQYEREIKTGKSIKANFDKIKEFFPYEINNVIKPNLLIANVKDMGQLETKLHDHIELVLGRKTYDAIIKIKNRNRSRSHIELSLTTPNGVHIGGFLALKDTGRFSDQSISYSILTLLGFQPSIFGPQLNEMHVPGLVDHKGKELDELHYALISVLYHPDMIAGAKIDEISKVFIKIYPSILAQYLARSGEHRADQL